LLGPLAFLSCSVSRFAAGGEGDLIQINDAPMRPV
jgi:hypothetical protein